MRTRTIPQFLLLALLISPALFGQLNPVIGPNVPGFTAFVGDQFSQTFTCTGCGSTVNGIQLSWDLASGVLPDGLDLDPDTGIVSGVPTTPESFGFIIEVTSNDVSIAQRSYTFDTVNHLQWLTTSPLPPATAGVATNRTVQVTTASLWTSSQSTLPSAVTVSLPANGGDTVTIAGTFPLVTSPTTYTIQLSATSQAAPESISQVFSLTVNPAPFLSATLPTAEVGVPYNGSFIVAGGTPPFAYSTALTAGGTLPPGLMLTQLTGAIKGTPTKAGTYAGNAYVSDTNGAASVFGFSINVVPPPAVATTSLPAGQVGVAYSGALTATGGVTPYTWTISKGTLPPGLSLNGTGGTIGGVPTTPGTSQFTAQVTDADGVAASAALSLKIASATLTITTASIPNAPIGVSYIGILTASGGNPPYTWTLDSGTLPPGLTVTSSGLITGTPAATSTGSYTFTVRVTDTPVTGAAANSATKSLSLQVVSGGPAITTGTLPNGTVGQAYSATLAATGGTPPYSWSVSAGLPAGLSLSSSGVLSGTPTTASSSTFTITVTDSQKQTAAQSFSITIAPAVVSSLGIGGALSNGTLGVVYAGTVTATGGTPPYTFSVSSGALPGGLSLNASSGAVTGTPTAAGSFTLTITVTDSQKQTAAKSFSITIAPNAVSPLGIGGALSNGTLGVVYAGTVTATGGTPPYTFSVSSGALPDGLSLNASSGAIGGTPAKSGAFTFTVGVSDSSQPALAVSKSFTIDIALPPLPVVSLVTQLQNNTTPSGSQPVFGVTLAQAYPVDLSGTATITFTPLGGLPADPDVLFANGLPFLTFTVPAGQTAAVASTGSPLAFSAGTTAGTITIGIVFTAGGAPVTPNPAPTVITVPPAAPVITGITYTPTSTGFTALVTGYSNTHAVSAASFVFTPVAGSTLTTSQFSVAVSPAFQAWFSSPTSQSTWGGQFELTVPFTITQGSFSSLASMQVTLTNTAGSGSGTETF